MAFAVIDDFAFGVDGLPTVAPAIKFESHEAPLAVMGAARAAWPPTGFIQACATVADNEGGDATAVAIAVGADGRQGFKMMVVAVQGECGVSLQALPERGREAPVAMFAG